VAGELDFRLQLSEKPRMLALGIVYLLDINARCAFEDLRRNQLCKSSQKHWVVCTWTTARFPETQISDCSCTCVCLKLTSSFQDLSRPLLAIRERQRDDLIVLGEFDLL
jgi:hypothetical protein